jgi:hypothetical protein
MEQKRLGLTKLAGIVLATGWLPLLAYCIFDALRGGGGNPIGLGLLMLVCTTIAILLMIGQGIRAAYKRFGGGKH